LNSLSSAADRIGAIELDGFSQGDSYGRRFHGFGNIASIMISIAISSLTFN
jgi:hypothetical protein